MAGKWLAVAACARPLAASARLPAALAAVVCAARMQRPRSVCAGRGVARGAAHHWSSCDGRRRAPAVAPRVDGFPEQRRLVAWRVQPFRRRHRAAIRRVRGHDAVRLP
eukprot:5880749-Prymnesium_polylepis.1